MPENQKTTDRASETSPRVPPCSEEAERGVLGAILLDENRRGVIDIAIDKALKPQDFYVAAHKLAYDQILTLHAKGIPVDLLTVTNALQTAGRLEHVGGSTALQRLIDATPTAAHAEYYIQIVKDKALLRSIVACASELITGCYEIGDEETAEGLRSEAEFMFAMLAERGGRDLMSTEEALAQMAESLDQARKTGCAGIATGFKVIDMFLGGLMPGATIWLSGQAGCGKTTLARNICENLAERIPAVPSVIFSIEQTAPLVWGAIAARHSKQSYYHLLTGSPYASLGKWDVSRGIVAKYPIIVDDRPQTLASLRSRIIQFRKALRTKFGTEDYLVVIDYLQKVKAVSRGNDTDESRIASVSSGITDIAKELLVPILAINSLSRADKLRGSGQLDYDAWGHLRLSVDKPVDEHGDQPVTVNLDKQRFGPHFTPEEMRLIGKEGRFADARDAVGEAWKADGPPSQPAARQEELLPPPEQDDGFRD